MKQICQTCFEIPLSAEQSDQAMMALATAENDYSYALAISKVPAKSIKSLTPVNRLIWHLWDLMSKAEGVESKDFIMPEHFNVVRGDDGASLQIDSTEAGCASIAAFTQSILKAFNLGLAIPISCAVYGETMKTGQDHGQLMLVSAEIVLNGLGPEALDIEKKALEAGVSHYVVPINKFYDGKKFPSQVLVSRVGESKCSDIPDQLMQTWDASGKFAHSEIMLYAGLPVKISAYEHSILAAYLEQEVIA